MLMSSNVMKAPTRLTVSARQRRGSGETSVRAADGAMSVMAVLSVGRTGPAPHRRTGSARGCSGRLAGERCEVVEHFDERGKVALGVAEVAGPVEDLVGALRGRQYEAEAAPQVPGQ